MHDFDEFTMKGPIFILWILTRKLDDKLTFSEFCFACFLCCRSIKNLELQSDSCAIPVNLTCGDNFVEWVFSSLLLANLPTRWLNFIGTQQIHGGVNLKTLVWISKTLVLEKLQTVCEKVWKTNLLSTSRLIRSGCVWRRLRFGTRTDLSKTKSRV